MLKKELDQRVKEVTNELMIANIELSITSKESEQRAGKLTVLNTELRLAETLYTEVSNELEAFFYFVSRFGGVAARNQQICKYAKGKLCTRP